MQDLYNAGGDLQDCCRQLMALPFLPEDQVTAAFDWLEEITSDLNLQQLTDYMRTQWIENASVPMSLWCCHGRDVRTNNGVEGWHHRHSTAYFSMRESASRCHIYAEVPGADVTSR